MSHFVSLWFIQQEMDLWQQEVKSFCELFFFNETTFFCGTLGTLVLSIALSHSCQIILQAPVKTDLTGGSGGERARENI